MKPGNKPNVPFISISSNGAGCINRAASRTFFGMEWGVEEPSFWFYVPYYDPATGNVVLALTNDDGLNTRCLVQNNRCLQIDLAALCERHDVYPKKTTRFLLEKDLSGTDTLIFNIKGKPIRQEQPTYEKLTNYYSDKAHIKTLY
jgi:hypothetical protein